MTATLVVTIHPTRRGLYTTVIAGKPLLSRPTRDPEYASCRELVRRGYADAPVLFIRVGSDIIASSVRSLYAAAKLTVVEDTTRGPRVVVHGPMWPACPMPLIMIDLGDSRLLADTP